MSSNHVDGGKVWTPPKENVPILVSGGSVLDDTRSSRLEIGIVVGSLIFSTFAVISVFMWTFADVYRKSTTEVFYANTQLTLTQMILGIAIFIEAASFIGYISIKGISLFDKANSKRVVFFKALSAITVLGVIGMTFWSATAQIEQHDKAEKVAFQSWLAQHDLAVLPSDSEENVNKYVQSSQLMEPLNPKIEGTAALKVSFNVSDGPGFTQISISQILRGDNEK